MDLDFLNRLSMQTKPAEAPDYKPHPLGEFHGTVLSSEVKYVKQMNNSVVELKIETFENGGVKVGVATYNEWLFTPEDIEKAQRHKEDLDKLKARISRMKRLFVDLEVLSHEVVDAMPWSNPYQADAPGILESFNMLVGRKCSLTVKANIRPGKPSMIYVNAAQDTVWGISAPAPQVSKKAPSAPMGTPSPMAPPVYGGPQSMSSGNAQRNAPPSGNLNGIPF